MLFIVIVLSIPVYGFFIWGLYEPEEAMLFLDKWRYDELPEFSELQFLWYKISNILGIVVVTVVILITIFATFWS